MKTIHGWLLLPVLLFLHLQTKAQRPIGQLPGTQQTTRLEEEPYYEVFDQDLTTRLYLARRYTSVFLDAPKGTESLRYRPNTLTTMGINGSYKALSLSLGAGFGFLNPNREERGKTQSFDFRTHFYPRDWVTDVYAQFYRGYYLKGGEIPGTRDVSYETRPDIRTRLLGISTFHLFNGKNFSYRAGFLQNEWQKKSAGSFLLGGQIWYGRVKGDSALVPARLEAFYPQAGIDRVRMIGFGPGAGYAYTYVYEEHFFATGSVTLNTDISFTKEESIAGNANRVSFSPNATLRLVGGYNSRNWALTVAWFHNTTSAKGRSSDFEYSLRTGAFGVTLARRFSPGKRLRKQLDGVIDRIPG